MADRADYAIISLLHAWSHDGLGGVALAALDSLSQDRGSDFLDDLHGFLASMRAELDTEPTPN